jgi:hypothetical protein
MSLSGLGYTIKREIMLSYQAFLAASFIIIPGIVFGTLGLIANFRHAKDIFTPTRKSVLISGGYLILAMLSCILPGIAISDKMNLSGAVLAICIASSPILLYMALGYFYAVSQEGKK